MLSDAVPSVVAELIVPIDEVVEAFAEIANKAMAAALVIRRKYNTSVLIYSFRLSGPCLILPKSNRGLGLG